MSVRWSFHPAHQHFRWSPRPSWRCTHPSAIGSAWQRHSRAVRVASQPVLWPRQFPGWGRACLSGCRAVPPAAPCAPAPARPTDRFRAAPSHRGAPLAPRLDHASGGPEPHYDAVSKRRARSGPTIVAYRSRQVRDSVATPARSHHAQPTLQFLQPLLIPEPPSGDLRRLCRGTVRRSLVRLLPQDHRHGHRLDLQEVRGGQGRGRQVRLLRQKARERCSDLRAVPLRRRS